MVQKAKDAPDEFHTVTPYLCIAGAAVALDFYKAAFDAEESMRHADPDGTIRHAQFRIGDSMFMLSDDFSEFPEVRSAQSFGGSPVSIFLTVEGADAIFAQAIAAGAKQVMPMADQEYGRSGGFADPFGLIWWVTTPPKPAP
jgi:PhnB protein